VSVDATGSDPWAEVQKMVDGELFEIVFNDDGTTTVGER
jgi:hypothetical protein